MMRFLEFLESLSHGDTLDDIDEAFGKVLAGVHEHRKKGSLVLEFTFDTPKGMPVNQVQIVDKVTAKIPEKDRQATFMFMKSHQGAGVQLTKRDPRQPELPMTSNEAVRAAEEMIGGANNG